MSVGIAAQVLLQVVSAVSGVLTLAFTIVGVVIMAVHLIVIMRRS